MTHNLDRKTTKGTAEVDSIHSWLRYHFGKANKCENKSCLKTAKRFEYALIHGKKYERKRENYKMLCSQCHRRYDFATGVYSPAKYGKWLRLLSQYQAEQIRKLYESGIYTQIRLGKMFKVDQPTISKIVLNQTYVA